MMTRAGSLLLLVALTAACDDGGGPSAADAARDAAPLDAPMPDGAPGDRAPVGDRAAADGGAPARACPTAGKVFRCLVVEVIMAPGARECVCTCADPGAPQTRPACDPAEFPCCGFEASTTTCSCTNAVNLQRLGLDCARFVGQAARVPSCP